MPTYNANCHCSAVRFRFESPAITAGVRCNCSICIRRGAVMSVEYFDPGRFKLLEGSGALRTYRFAEQSANHYFCDRCGIYTFHDTADRRGHYRVNLGCVEDLDPLALTITLIDGRSF